MRLTVSLLLVLAWTIQAAAAARPKLVLNIVVDQFRYDYLTRFAGDYKGGLAQLTRQGAVFTNAYYEHFPTVTAIGHATILTGAYPSVSGIVGNEWFDRASGKNVTSVSDEGTQILGAAGQARRGSSPHRLNVSTVCDELKMAEPQTTRCVGISAKDRGAILPVGRMADGAFWFDTASGNFVSSTWYGKQLPAWAEKFNAGRGADKYLSMEWKNPAGGAFAKMDAKAGSAYYESLDRSPYASDLLVAFADAALAGEQLGTRGGTDVLSVSFSVIDKVGHGVGPHAPEVRDLAIQMDRSIGELFKVVDAKVGLANTLVVFSADHGVAPLPEYMRERRMPGGRMNVRVVRDAVQQALTAKYGEGQWVVGYSGPAPYLNRALIAEKRLAYEEVQNVAAEAARGIPQIYRVYTRAQLMSGRLLEDLIDRRVRNGFHVERSSDLFVVIEPFWLFESHGTSHGTPYNYDAHVPVILMGPWFRPGRYHAHVAVNDVAPTVATLLGVEPPSGSAGRVLTEALAQ